MIEDETELRRLFGALAREEGRRDPDEHPDAETLIAYRANELSPEEDRKVQEHLAACDQCTELLLDLETFNEPPTNPVAPAADFEAAADWKKLRERLSLGERKTGSWRRMLASLAAAVALVSVGLFLYERSSQVTKTVVLRPINSSRGEAGPVTLEKKERVLLQLAAPVRAPIYPEYRVKIFDPKGREVWSREEVMLELNYFNVIPPRRLSTDGLYRIRVWGVQTGHEEPVSDYEWRISNVPDSRQP